MQATSNGPPARAVLLFFHSRGEALLRLKCYSSAKRLSAFPLMTPMFRLAVAFSIFFLLPCAFAQLNPEQQKQVDAAVRKVVEDSGVPSASVGLVQNNRVVYARAFGLARLQPPVPASAAMAYPIGSISKQFTATAVLLLQQEGKLRLDDPVAKYFPSLTRASDVTLRNLLTHTSGYQDYAPQDYTIPRWRQPGDPLKVVEEFAGKPLDFEPGTQWQYSNTNFVLAALIVQKVSGMPFAEFLRTRVLEPAKLQDVLNLNTDQAQLQVTGYLRNALAPLRPAGLEAPGWYFGDGDLAMPVASLLTWDLTLLNETLLLKASYAEMESSFHLKDGEDSHYGLGVSIRTIAGQRAIEHSGEVGGFVAENLLLPESKVAIAVLTNQEASGAAGEIARALLPIVTARAVAGGPAESTAEAFAVKLQPIMAGLEQGRIDRSLLTADANDYFSPVALMDFESSLAPLGTVSEVRREGAALRGGMTFGSYRVSFSGGTAVHVTVYLQPDGRIEQLLVEGKE